MAVTYEYHDDDTSEQRKQLLRMRYPQYLIPEPDYKYQRPAWEEVRAEGGGEGKRSERLKEYAIATAFWSVVAVLMFCGFVVLVQRFDPPPYGSVVSQAWFLASSFVEAHSLPIAIWTVLLVRTSVVVWRLVK